MKKFFVIFSVLFLLVLSASAQWKPNEKDTSLTFYCPECPAEAKVLKVSFSEFQLGTATEVDMIYLDYTSSPVLEREAVQLDGTDKERYEEFIWFVSNAYGWIEMLVHYPGGCYTYVVPTIQAYAAEKFRAY